MPKKGKALERAVKFIQEAILDSNPQLKGVKFTVEANQIVNVRGVRHEIDVLVKTLPNSDYEAKWVFECKDWKEPVGKNEVMVLSGKVKDLNANRGFLVARRITKDAKAAIANDPCLKFLECSSDFLSPLSIELSHTMHEHLPITLRVKIRGYSPLDHPSKIEWEGQPCLLEGRPVDFQEYIGRFVRDLAEQDRYEQGNLYYYEGVHSSVRCMEMVMSPNELWVGDMEIESMTLIVWFFVTVTKRPVMSRFEIKGQGSVFSFEPVDCDLGKPLEIDIVAVHAN